MCFIQSVRISVYATGLILFSGISHSDNAYVLLFVANISELFCQTARLEQLEWTAPFILPEFTTEGYTGFSLSLSPTLSWLTIKTSKVHQRSHCLQKRQEDNPYLRKGEAVRVGMGE